MASKRRRPANRDHQAVARKSARSRAMMAAARAVTKPVETEHASRERARARKLMDLVIAAWNSAAADLTGGAEPSAVLGP